MGMFIALLADGRLSSSSATPSASLHRTERVSNSPNISNFGVPAAIVRGYVRASHNNSTRVYRRPLNALSSRVPA